MSTPLYAALASLLAAIENCRKAGNEEWLDKHNDRLDALCGEYLPSGSGVDNGTALDRKRSTPDKLVLITSFHHMDEHGNYDDWTEHVVTVRASLTSAIALHISGRNRADVKEYLYDLFHTALTTEVDGR